LVLIKVMQDASTFVPARGCVWQSGGSVNHNPADLCSSCRRTTARGWRALVSRREPGDTSLGNRWIERTIIEHDPGVGLNVPVRVLIYEEPAIGICRLANDLPSSLMARLQNNM
jgi:hypothetical protein